MKGIIMLSQLLSWGIFALFSSVSGVSSFSSQVDLHLEFHRDIFIQHHPLARHTVVTARYQKQQNLLCLESATLCSKSTFTFVFFTYLIIVDIYMAGKQKATQTATE